MFLTESSGRSLGGGTAAMISAMRNLLGVLAITMAGITLLAPTASAAEHEVDSRAISRRTQEPSTFVPVIFDGGGWTQQLLLQNVGEILSATGTVTFHRADGSPWVLDGPSASGPSARYTFELATGETLVVPLPESTGELAYGYARIEVSCGSTPTSLGPICPTVFAQTDLIRGDSAGREQMTSFPATEGAIFGFHVPFDNRDSGNTLVSILTTSPCFGTAPCTTDLSIKFKDSTGIVFHQTRISQTNGTLRMLDLSEDFPMTVGRSGSVQVAGAETVVARVAGAAFRTTSRGGFMSIATLEDAILPKRVLESSILRIIDELGSDKTFVLENRQVWAQDDFQFIYPVGVYPKVLIWKDGLHYRMWIEGETQTIRVRRIE